MGTEIISFQYTPSDLDPSGPRINLNQGQTAGIRKWVPFRTRADKTTYVTSPTFPRRAWRGSPKSGGGLRVGMAMAMEEIDLCQGPWRVRVLLDSTILVCGYRYQQH